MSDCVQCSTSLENGKFCNMDCKKGFLLDFYSDSQANKWFMEKEIKFKVAKDKIIKDFQNSGKSLSDYLLAVEDE